MEKELLKAAFRNVDEDERFGLEFMLEQVEQIGSVSACKAIKEMFEPQINRRLREEGFLKMFFGFKEFGELVTSKTMVDDLLYAETWKMNVPEWGPLLCVAILFKEGDKSEYIKAKWKVPDPLEALFMSGKFKQPE